MAEFTVCKVSTCSKPAKCRGLCNSHYMRWWKTGTASEDVAIAPRAKSGEPLAFLMDAVGNPPEECVVWPYAKNPSGYGKVWVDGKHKLVHRLSWELYHGRSMSSEKCAAHDPIRCHNPSCINPLHIREASYSENQDDTLLDGTKRRGETAWNNKLSQDDVLAIRQDKRPRKIISAEYGIAISTVSHIRRKAIWSWLD